MSNLVKLFLIALVITLIIIFSAIFLVPSLKNKVFPKPESDIKEEVKTDEKGNENNVTEEQSEDVKIKETAMREIRQQEDEAMSFKQVKELGELLREREKQIKIEEERVMRLREMLKKEQDDIIQVKKDIKKMHKEIAEFIPLITNTEKKNLKKMAKMFETLSVENASPIMERMPDQTLVIVLSLMKPRASAKLLGGYALINTVNAERAGQITEKLKKIVVK